MGSSTMLEIFLLDAAAADVFDWLNRRLGGLTHVDQQGDISFYAAPHAKVTVTRKIEDGPFGSICVAGELLPWASHVECARDAATSLARVVRGQLESHPYGDVLLEIGPKGEVLVEWETEPRMG